MIENQKINNSNFNNIQLSEGAINFLDNQIIKNGESKTIEVKFTFQIIHAIKKLSDWYCCSLLDRNSKYGGFCVKYANQYGEPKKGDIIQTNKIQIIKLPNKDTKLYFCTDVKKLNESKKMIIDPKNLVSISKKKSISKKNTDLNYGLLENTKKNINNKSHKNPLRNLDKNNNNNITQSKYTLISYLDNFTNNPRFLLKCRYKSKIIEYTQNNTKKHLQNYLFYDTNGDEVQGTAYDKCAEDYDEIIQTDSVYEIYKAKRYTIKPQYLLAECKIGLLFKNYTKIEKAEDNGEFQNFRKKDFIIIGQLSKDNINAIINVRAIILEDEVKTEKKIENDKSIITRRLLIGDDSLHKIKVSLYDEKAEKEKKYSKGEIITLYYIKFCKYKNYYNLYCNKCTEIKPCDNPQREKELKDFYIQHPSHNEYKDINYVILNSLNTIKFKFLQDAKDDYIIEYNDNHNDINYNLQNLIKINGTIINFNHNESIFNEYCVFCNKKSEEFCPYCLSEEKKLMLTLNIEISDCTGNLWIELFGETAENFIGTNVEEYEKLINNNDIFNLNKISQKILYHNYSFIGKCKMTYGEDSKCLFYVIHFNENDKIFFKELVDKIKQSL